MRTLRPSSLLLLAILAAGCDSPTEPPVPAEALELELTSIFEQTWPQQARGWVEMAVALEPSVPAADTARITSLAVTWPIRAVVLDIPTDFVEAADGRLRAARTVPRDDGLGKGLYFLDIGFDDGRTVRIEKPHQAPTLLAPQVLELSRTGDEVILRWRTTPQAHDWTIAVRRTTDDAILFEYSGSTANIPGNFQLGVTVPDPADYEIELVMRSPSNLRRIIYPVPPAS